MSYLLMILLPLPVHKKYISAIKMYSTFNIFLENLLLTAFSNQPHYSVLPVVNTNVENTILSERFELFQRKALYKYLLLLLLKFTRELS